MAIECLVLGAGQEVGKSCVVVSIGGKRIMFDCGMHMGYCDDRRYPNFSLVSETGDFDSALTCIVITHFHLDHVGALPYFTEVCGYKGPIYMTYPTKALAPLMLEDYRKVMVERRGEEEQFSYENIIECMKKVTPLDLKQTVQVDEDLHIRAYYAGHVLGAAMIYAKVGVNAMVYTGDYNMTPDRHLGAAQIDRLRLDLVITESTYATTVRDSKYAREREFLKAVHKCVAGGGKVLIPTFALGRAQELCILLDDYWERMNLKIPIYFSAGLTIQANMYYKMLISWMSQKIKDTYSVQNTFDFKHVCPFDRSLIHEPGPCVLFATPGMISGGFSLEVFKRWAPSEKNLVTLPGYCVAGTIGHKLMSGKATRIDLDKDTQIDVRCQIHQLSFSPHTDAKGIMDLIGFLSPQHVILVHGEKPKMAKLKGRIKSELGIECYDPANNETVSIPTVQIVKLDATKKFIRSCSSLNSNRATNSSTSISDSSLRHIDVSKLARDETVAEGVLVMEKGNTAKIMSENELLQYLGVEEHEIKCAYCCSVKVKTSEQLPYEPGSEVFSSTKSSLPEAKDVVTSTDSASSLLLQSLSNKLKVQIDCRHIQSAPDKLQLNTFQVRVCANECCPYRIREDGGDKSAVFFCCSWSLTDEKLARKIILIMGELELGSFEPADLIPHCMTSGSD
ncbi:cleavage and polyadenylation specificity factor subunit 3-II [Iris pallida]|uniref:Cleavage and polyadenylation specificity factor subunit 3-II n=1 Tax=Iris pallida TaxID=29817 RepID=A0AAX6DQE2_IRIPA|nr:cleavage and polyadenylation specificity factor subunit 3-II [Iris pallida]